MLQNNLKLNKKVQPQDPGKGTMHTLNLVDMDPRVDPPEDTLSPCEGTKKIQTGDDPLQVTYLGVNLDPEEEAEIMEVLYQNIDLFAWKSSDMPDIDPNVMCHHLALDPGKRKGDDENRKAITEEAKKLLEANFIKEIKYPTWISNVVMEKKKSDKWRICADFTDLNKACPKDRYPFPPIDCMIDDSSGYRLLNFMDAYSG